MGKVVISGNYDATIRISDWFSSNEIKTLYGHRGWVRYIQYNDNKKLLFTVSDDKTARIWCSETGLCLVCYI